jgi:hypothetical protein
LTIIPRLIYFCYFEMEICPEFKDEKLKEKFKDGNLSRI